MKKSDLKKKEALELILSDNFFRDYYFRNAKDSKYFKTFNENGLFQPSENPSPIEVKDGYQIPEWNVLPYLEIISQKTRKLDSELLTIIEELMEKSELFVAEQGSPHLSFINSQSSKPRAVLIGPEGGWSDTEKIYFDEKSLKYVTLSKFTLRAETACIVASSLLQ